jgi:hypothetical protein
MRISPRFSQAASVVALSLLLLPATHRAAAQSKPTPAAVPAAPTDEELSDTREQLLALLKMSPTLTQVLETDPTLLADQDYITRTNPQLAQFLTQHPEVTRNPDFYLFANLSGTGRRHVESLERRTNGGNTHLNEVELHRIYVDDTATLLGFIAFFATLLWLIRILLENRRWSRVFRQQSEVHSKLIDRFANNQELLHYMETEPGKRFLEASPIPVAVDRNQPLPGGLGRVLGSLQIGIVLTLLGIGLLGLVHRLIDIADPLFVFGMVAMMPGIGFIISAIVTWRISARLGLMPQPAASSAELSHRQ